MRCRCWYATAACFVALLYIRLAYNNHLHVVQRNLGGNLAIDSLRQIFILFGDGAWILATIRWLNVGEVGNVAALLLMFLKLECITNVTFLQASLSLKKASSDVGRLKVVFRFFGIAYVIGVTLYVPCMIEQITLPLQRQVDPTDHQFRFCMPPLRFRNWVFATTVQGSTIAYEWQYICLICIQLFIQLTFLSTGIIFYKLGAKSDGDTSSIRRVMMNVLVACGLQFVFIAPLVDAFFDYPGYEITIDSEQGIDPVSGKDFAAYMSNLSPDTPTSLEFRNILFNYTVFNRVLIAVRACCICHVEHVHSALNRVVVVAVWCLQACPLVYIFALIRIAAPSVLARFNKTAPSVVVPSKQKQGAGKV